jgi:phosphoinositide-3-kinase regulatory subunit 4
MLVTVITPSNVSIFPEYIIPNIKHLVHDPDVSVRCAYAQCMSGLAETAVRYLEMGQALKAHGAFKLARGAATGESVGVGEYESAYFEVCLRRCVGSIV